MTQPPSTLPPVASLSDPTKPSEDSSPAFDFDELVRLKVCQFLSTVSGHYPDKLYKLLMDKMEKPLLCEVLKQAGGNQAKASRILGLTRNTLHRKLKHHGLMKSPHSSVSSSPRKALANPQ